MRKHVKSFFFPELNRKYFLRLAIVAAVAFVVFRFLLLPMRIRAGSMEPNWHDGGFTFCWRFKYRFRPLERGSVVIVRFTGRDIMLLKRVVAFEGETVEFRGGVLHVNGEPVDEPYVVYPCDWELEPRVVKPGYVYVVGDNRSMPIDAHRFGQTDRKRITGGPLW